MYFGLKNDNFLVCSAPKNQKFRLTDLSDPIFLTFSHVPKVDKKKQNVDRAFLYKSQSDIQWPETLIRVYGSLFVRRTDYFVKVDFSKKISSDLFTYPGSLNLTFLNA